VPNLALHIPSDDCLSWLRAEQPPYGKGELLGSSTVLARASANESANSNATLEESGAGHVPWRPAASGAAPRPRDSAAVGREDDRVVVLSGRVQTTAEPNRPTKRTL
jgi:hypothetical protein